jgi:hypothetical protein
MEIDYRYELKYVYPQEDYWGIVDSVLLHPYMFKEVFSSRKVCNIYLDTFELRNYHDNLIGIKNRQKNRIRWYNDDLSKPILEYKNKIEKLGWKDSYKMPALVLDGFSWNDYLTKIDAFHVNSDAYIKIMRDMKSQEPILNNTYSRRYFMSFDGLFRITVDHDMQYRRVDKHGLGQGFNKDRRVIVEVKFSKKDFMKVKYITGYFNNSISSNSKYVSGVNSIYFNKVTPYERLI